MKRFLLSLIVCCFACAAQATIHVYYASGSSSNSLVVTGGNFQLDLNNDSFADFTISIGFSSVSLSCATGNDFCAYNNGTPRALNAGNSTIGPYGTNGLLDTYFSTVNYKFIGLRVKSGVNYYHGWAEARVDNNGYLNIYRYAYNDIPNQMIAAGQVVNVQEELAAPEVSIHQEGGNLIIETEAYRQGPVHFTLSSIAGVELQNMRIRSASVQASLSALTPGIYLVNIVSKGKSLIRKKIFVY